MDPRNKHRYALYRVDYIPIQGQPIKNLSLINLDLYLYKILTIYTFLFQISILIYTKKKIKLKILLINQFWYLVLGLVLDLDCQGRKQMLRWVKKKYITPNDDSFNFGFP